MAAGTLRDLLSLTALGRDRFVAPPPASEGQGHVFGGHVAAQALRAACATVGDDRLPHSLHAYFVRGGVPGEKLDIEVDRVRDGRSFSVRRVVAGQAGGDILILDASFHVGEPGRTWPEPAVPGVASPGASAENGSYLHDLPWLDVFDIRPIHPNPGRPAHPLWVRTIEALGDDPIVHACALTSIVDMGMAGSAIGDLPFTGRMGPTLDHCLWLHTPARADEWLLFDAARAAVSASRGLVTGTLRTADGLLVATITQEVLLRDGEGDGGRGRGPGVDLPPRQAAP
ncbi:MAG: thioesterase family protein [Acidobacteria bacterium]|nr:thioesterase family protein [Acidobacteriota bacterium]